MWSETLTKRLSIRSPFSPRIAPKALLPVPLLRTGTHGGTTLYIYKPSAFPPHLNVCDSRHPSQHPSTGLLHLDGNAPLADSLVSSDAVATVGVPVYGDGKFR
jgi:hypothetical protein